MVSKQILVTGGAGFIGGHLVEHFLKKGHDVVAIDNLDPYYSIKIKNQNVEIASDIAADNENSYEFIDGDIRNESLIRDLVTNADYIYHQAAQAGVRSSVQNPQKPNSINVQGTLNILEAARASDTERVIVASSSSVYGKPEYLPYDEEHPTNPVSPYGVSKLAAEQYTRVYNEIYDLPTVALRYFTVYGPRMRPNMAISNFVSRCVNDEPPIVYGSGDQTRDFTYIEDIVEANEKLLNNNDADGKIINIGSTDNISIIELAQMIRDQIAPAKEIEYTNRNSADAEHTHADVTKARDLINYTPTTSIEEGVSKFIEWYQENRDWYGSIITESQ